MPWAGGCGAEKPPWRRGAGRARGAAVHEGQRTGNAAADSVCRAAGAAAAGRAVVARQGPALFDAFHRVGALVFGGGHVMPPLLQAVVALPPGWVTADTFLAAMARRRRCRGPVHVCSLSGRGHGAMARGMLRALVCLVAIFVPLVSAGGGRCRFGEPLRAVPTRRRAGGSECRRGGAAGGAVRPGWTSAIPGG